MSPADATPSSATKTCGTCTLTLPLTDFAMKNSASGLRQSRCKQCQREYTRAHYAANRDDYLERTSERNKRVKRDYRENVETHLAAQACCKCNTGLELYLFHKPGYKGLPVHELIRRSAGAAAFDEALANSDVFCRECLGEHFTPNLVPYQFGNPEREANIDKARERRAATVA